MRWRRGAAEQRREVEGWRSSGLTAAQYAARRGYSVANLKRWAKGLEAGPQEVAAPRFVRLEIAAPPIRAIVVEVGAARIQVEPGFDADHLHAVVAALVGRDPC